MIEYNASEQTEIPETNGFSVKIIGVGGSGANVLDRMALEGSEAGDLLTINTDVRALSTSVSNNKIQLGKELLMGMGAGGDPELGREAVLEAEDEIRAAVRGYSMVFVCVGLGGGTGSGAAPEVCRIAREEGAFLVAFTAMPFGFEGKRRMQQASNALIGIGEYANAVVTFENDRMGELIVAKEGIQQAFAAADKLISQSILATTNMVTQPGIIRLGMDDLLTALRNRDSRCLFGFGQAKGDNRAQEALSEALKSPLIDKGYLMDSAENVLIHISGGDSLTLYEVELLMGELAKHVNPQAQILFGVGTDKKLGNSLAVTLISSVSSEKIGSGGKKGGDKKKALSKDEGSGDDDGDDDGGGGGSGSDGEPGSEDGVAAAADGAPPPGELDLDTGPGAKIADGPELAEPIPQAGSDEPEWGALEPEKEDLFESLEGSGEEAEGREEPGALETGVGEVESAEIPSSATEEADDGISADEVQQLAEDEGELETGEADALELDAVEEPEPEPEHLATGAGSDLDEEPEDSFIDPAVDEGFGDDEPEPFEGGAEEWVSDGDDDRQDGDGEPAASQGIASLLGLTPMGADSGESDGLLAGVVMDEVSSEPFTDDQPDAGDEVAGLSPFEIDDELEEEVEDGKGEGVESSEDEESVVSEDEVEGEKQASAPMSILDLARRRRQSAQADSDDSELIVHSLDDEEKPGPEDIDEVPVVPLPLGEADEPVARAKSVSEVILSAAAGEGGDQEITLSRVDSFDDEEVAQERDSEINSEEGEPDTGGGGVGAVDDGIADEKNAGKAAAKLGKASAQSQGVFELEPEAKGRFAKANPTIVDGQDLDVPTFLRARRD